MREDTMRSKEELLQKLSDDVVEMEEEEVQEAAQEYLEAGYPAIEGIMDGLVDGMNRAGDLYEEEEYFVTDLLLCSDAMYEGLDVLKPSLPQKTDEKKFTCIIGVVQGDTHDIGKNLVKIMLETAGFNIIDLGRDVPAEKFVEAVKKENAEILCMSTLMTTTMGEMEKVIKLLEEEGLRDKVGVMVGGSPVSQNFADRIGADGYSDSAVEAVKLAKRLVNIA
jgi:corrinoid protein of di/trimethylamine methyltransferase